MAEMGSGSFDPVASLIAYHAAINALDFDAIAAMFADDAVYVSGGIGGMTEGRGAIMAAFRAYFDIYPDQMAEDDSVERQGPLSARAAWRLIATHRATGEPLVRRGLETVTFDDTGRIVRVEVVDG